MKKLAILLSLFAVMAMVFAIGCGHGKPPVVVEPPPPPVAPETTAVVTPPPVEPPPAPLELTTIHFDFDKFNLRPDARDIMAQNADGLSKHAAAVIKIEGHCDERGSEAYNMALGEKRATAARDYLVNYGVNKDKISVISYGKSRPVDTGHDENAWAKNRRADFIVVCE
jgi:peptidoglycan-associated lipoprotein